MKYTFIILSLLFSLAAFASGKDKEPATPVIVDQDQYTHNDVDVLISNKASVGGYNWRFNEGDTNLINLPNFSGETSDVRIGTRSLPVPNLSFGANRLDNLGEIDGMFYGFTLTAPLYFWWKKIGEAEAVETIRLKQVTEIHQAEMMSMCLILHTKGVIHEGGSPELWARCKNYEHHPSLGGTHKGEGNPRQVSPHKKF